MKVLSRNEMKQLTGGLRDEGGGGSCCWHTAGWTQSDCGLSKGDAQAVATAYALLSGQNGYWCCASC